MYLKVHSAPVWQKGGIPRADLFNHPRWRTGILTFFVNRRQDVNYWLNASSLTLFVDLSWPWQGARQLGHMTQCFDCSAAEDTDWLEKNSNHMTHQNIFPVQGTYPPGQGTYPPAKVPTPLPSKVPTPLQGTYSPIQGTYLAPPPRYLSPRIGQHMEYFIRCGRYASCVYAGGQFCQQYAILLYSKNIIYIESKCFRCYLHSS